jgi:hypothetical protein
MLYGIDLSRHNPTFDYARAHREGAAFIIHKATEGTSYQYEQVFHDRMPAIASSGAVPGAYHFLRSGDGAAQARYFYSVVAPWLAHPRGFLAQLDHEGADYDPKPPLSVAYAFADEWARLSGGHPLTHYFPRWFWQKLGSPAQSRRAGPLWASPYITGSGTFDQLAGRVPATAWTGYAGWPRPSIVQFTSSGVVAGAVGLDLNLFDGDQAALAALAGAPTLEDDVPFTCTQHTIPPAFAFDAHGTLTTPGAVRVLGTPLGGLTGLTRGWLSLSADFSDPATGGGMVPSTVRVATSTRTPDGHAAWTVQLVELDSASARRVVDLPAGCDKVSLGRVDAHAGAGATTPLTATLELSS